MRLGASFQLKLPSICLTLGATPHKMVREKTISLRRLYAQIASLSPVEMKATEVREFLRIVSEVIVKNVAPQTAVRIPYLATFGLHVQNAKPERTHRIGSGNQFVVPAKPITAVLKATVARDLQKKLGEKHMAKKLLAHAPAAADEKVSETQRATSEDID